MRFKFTHKEHEEYGTWGWVPAHMPKADPLSGMAVAHDCLEHFPKDDGSFEAEIQALGASLHVRGEDYYAAMGRSEISPGRQLAADFPTQWNYWLQGDRLRIPAPPAAGEQVLDNDFVEQWVQDGASQAVQRVRDECEATEDELIDAGFTYANISGWLRVGYRRAVRRYWRLSQAELVGMFMDIEREADAALKRLEEGEEATLYVTVAKGRASYTLRRPYD